MLRLELQNRISTVLVDKHLLGDLRTTGACYTDNDEVAEAGDDPNPSFCVRHTPLDTFDLSNQTLSVELATAMVSVFQQNPAFRYINLSGSNLIERLDIIMPVIPIPSLHLYSLNLSFCKLGTHGFAHLVQALSGMRTPLSELNLSGNDLDVQHMLNLSQWLSTNRRLKLLELAFNPKIGTEGLVLLTRALENAGHPLQTLGLSGIGLTDASADSFAELVRHPEFKVELLDVSWNTVGPETSGALVSLLGTIKSVRELHCMAMKTALIGTKALMESYRGNSTIEVLHLGSNYIPATLGPLINEVLPTLSNLKWVEFTSNMGSVDFVTCLQPSFSNLSNLTILSFCNIGISSAGADATGPIGNLIANSPYILELHLSFNNFTDSMAFAIADALQTRNRSLLNLRLDENEITREGVLALYTALQHNSVLQYLDISENDFDPSEFQTITFPNCPKRVIRLIAN